MSRRRLAAAAPLLALVALGACGSDSKSATTQPPADLVVVANHIAWDKPAYTATATDGKVVVRLQNDDLVNHNLHAVGADGVDSGTVIDANPNATKTGTFTLKPGTYTLICTVPGHSNMKATLTVS